MSILLAGVGERTELLQLLRVPSYVCRLAQCWTAEPSASPDALLPREALRLCNPPVTGSSRWPCGWIQRCFTLCQALLKHVAERL